MKHDSVHRNYARAIYEVAQEQGLEKEVFEQIKHVCTLLTEQLLAIIENPVFSSDEREAVVKKVSDAAKLNKPLRGLVRVLANVRALRMLPQVRDAYRETILKTENKELLKLRVARPLGDSQRKALVDKFSQIAGKELEVDEEIDPSLIGGVVVNLRSTVYDGSIKHRMQTVLKDIT